MCLTQKVGEAEWPLLELVGLPELVELLGPLGLLAVNIHYRTVGKLPAGIEACAWAFDSLVEDIESTLESEDEE